MDDSSNGDISPLGGVSPKGNIVNAQRATGVVSPKGDTNTYTVAPTPSARDGVRPAQVHSAREDRFIKNHPLPWRVDFIEMKPTRKCHHKSRSWVLFDANDRRIFWTEDVVRKICATMNAAMNAANDKAAK